MSDARPETRGYPRLERATVPLVWLVATVVAILGAAAAVSAAAISMDQRLTRVEEQLGATRGELARLELALARAPSSCFPPSQLGSP